MKRIFMLLMVMFCGIMVNFSVYHEETQKVLVVAELMGFEIEAIPEYNDEEEVIVQGMSGTLVMQDGKLVGAINCVSIDDPKDAYAIFIDKLL